MYSYSVYVILYYIVLVKEKKYGSVALSEPLAKKWELLVIVID